MRKIHFFTTGMVLLLLHCVFCGIAHAAASDTQTVTFEVDAINELNLDENPAALVINSATAGSQPDTREQATSYDITTNCAANGKKLTAILNSAMPVGTTLAINPSAPTGGTANSYVTLSAAAADIVTGIDAVAEANIALSYRLTATVAAGVLASDTRTVTVTIADAT